jgi:phosphatidate cytidylyltransferase
LARALVDPAAPGLPGTTSAGRWGDLRLRVISASVLLPLVLFCLWFGGWPWVALVSLATVGLAWEWLMLWRRRPGGAPLLKLIYGVPYLAPGAASLFWLRADPAVGLANVLFVLLIVWASDIGAYAAGRVFGGPKLAPAISPGKTWSGAAGGLVGACLVGAVAARFAADAPISHAALVAGVLGILAQLGDLLESWLKRHFGVKDSSRLIPGHGGLLDRLDGVLAAAPAAALLALLLGRGIELWR